MTGKHLGLHGSKLPSCGQVAPTLMRLRGLEVLERAAASGKLNLVLGEKGLAERVVNLL